MNLECCFIGLTDLEGCRRPAKFELSNGCPHEDCYACEEHLAELAADDDVITLLD